jgi:hypothetical protein
MAVKKNILAPKQDNSPELSEISLSAALLKEYDGLLNLYTHTENSINSIFNFYVTLLTTLTGAIIVLMQISNLSQGNLSWTISALLVLLILFGVITQDFLIYKDAELAYFTMAINSVKESLFKNFPEAQSQIFFLSSPYSHIRVDVSPLQLRPTLLGKIEKIFWWMWPLGMPQLFVSLMNSLALTAIFILLIISLMAGAVPVFRLIITSIFVLGSAYIAQCIYANMKFKGKISQGHISMNGEIHPWFQNSARK